MNITMKRVIALLLMLIILISSNLTGIVYAAPGDNGGSDQGSSGASYNQGTGDADIQTGTNKGGIKNYAKPEDWALSSYKGTLTPTKYQLKVDGKFYDVGMFYDVDWTNGVADYKNSKEDIEGFVNTVAGKSGMLAEEIFNKGFEVHINAMVYARKPYETAYNLYNIKEDYNLLMYNKVSGTGSRTWISWVVERAAKNLGSIDRGWAYYTVPPQKLKPVDYVVETFVKIIGVNPDGSLKFEKLKASEVREAEFDEKGAVKIDEVKELEEGTAYLDTIITSPKNLAKDNTDIDWTGNLPKTSKEKIEPTAEDIWRIMPGKTSALRHILDVMEVSETIEIGGSTLTDIEELRALSNDLNEGKDIEVSRLQKALMQISNLYDSNVINLENASPQFKKALVDRGLQAAINEYNQKYSPMTSTETLIKQAVIIPNANEVYLDTEHPGEVIEVELEIESPKTISNEEIIMVNNFKSNGEIEGKTVVYVRYVVIPTRKEVIFTETYKDGVLIDKTRTVKELPLVEVTKGIYESETYLTDMTNVNSNAVLVSWGTSKEAPLLKTMPSSPLKSGTVYEPIIGLETDENVYVTWKIETYSGNATSSFLVDEWRLSKYTDSLGFENKAYMGLSLRADEGHRTSTLSPSGKYNYDTVNPNGKITDNNYNPENMKYSSYLHSKALTQGNYSISHSKPSVFVYVTGNLNLIKSTELSGIRVASWTADNSTKTGLNLHNLEVSNKGVTFNGDSVIRKQDTLKYGIKNRDSYTHNYGVYYHYTCHHYDSKDKHSGCHDVCACYTLPETPGVTYSTADYKVDSTFERYRVANTDSRMFKLGKTETKVENGKTTVSEQNSAVLSVYPEIPMLFDNDKGDSSIKYAVGEIARKIQPVSFHALEYKAYVDTAKAVGMSVATDSRAKVTANKIGLGNAGVVHKGSGINTVFEVKNSKGSTQQGILEVRTYALDIQQDLKTAWGNTSYNTSTINDNFLSKFGSKQGGKWVFNAKATENLYIASTPAFTGADKVVDIKYNEKSKIEKEYRLTIRGGVVTHVNGTAIATVKTSNPDLYEALVGMKLVGGGKDLTVLSTFEHQAGKVLTEQKFIDLAKEARGVDDLSLGKGWYSEDSTVLIVKEYITEFSLPNTTFADKIPMTVSGLQTPVNKQQFYSTIAKGHHIVKYEVGNSIKAYFEHNTSKESPFGRAITSYGVPNVSITDTMGMN